jgi:hypothetical protein
MTETIYVVQGFTAGKRGSLKAMQPLMFPTESQARSRAERMGEACVGVMAFAQTADIDAGEYSDPVMLVRAGQVPDEA